MMKQFIISTQALKKVLHKLNYAIKSNSVIPVLGSIWCKVTTGSIEFIASDTEITIFCRQQCETSGDGFEFLMSFKLIQELVNVSKNEPWTFTMDEKGIKVTGDSGGFDLKNAFDIKDFPKLPALPKKPIELDENILSWLPIALKTVGNDEANKPKLTKVLLELREKEITVASTDGSFTLFSYSMEAPAAAEEDIIIVPKVIKVLDGIKKASLSWDKKFYAFDTEELTVIVTKPDHAYVNFRAIIPQDFSSNLTVNRADLVYALTRCNINSNPFKETKLTFKKDGTINFSARDSSQGINIYEDIKGTYTGPLKSLKFNCEKMLKLMHQVDFEEIEIAAHDEMRPILFRTPADKGYIALLMSMNVK